MNGAALTDMAAGRLRIQGGGRFAAESTVAVANLFAGRRLA
jgi:hypothetical protein